MIVVEELGLVSFATRTQSVLRDDASAKIGCARRVRLIAEIPDDKIRILLFLRTCCSTLCANALSVMQGAM